MAELSNNEFLGVSEYHYKLKNHSNAYIPIFIFDVPYTSRNIPDQILFKDKPTEPRRLNLYDFGIESITTWCVNKTKTFVNTFLEVYTDDFFTISTSTNSRGDIGFDVTFKDSNSSSLGTDGQLADYADRASITIAGYGVRTTDNQIFYWGISSGGYYRAWFYKIDNISVDHVITPPSENTNKGISVPVGYTSVGDVDKSATTKRFRELLQVSTLYDSKDPNSNGGDSKPNGGGGSGDIGGDTNPDDGLPTISALDSGLLTAYNPTVAELQSLGKFLWSDNFNLDSFKKLFNDPFDTLLGLSIVPINPNTSGSKNIMFGNMDSGVSAPVVSSQWVTKDMGSVTLNEVWKGALDYSPSTSASIYLPFIGMRQLNINDVMGSTLHLIYKFDVLTGGCVAQIYVNHNHLGNKDSGFSWTPNQGLLYEFMGQCAVNIPLASQDFTNTIRSAVSAVGMVAGTSASIATGNPVLGLATATMASANLGMQANTPTVERSGHLSGSCSLLGYYQPFLVVTRPHQCKPSRYYALRGVPSQVYTSKLSKCTGFTQITANNNIHVVGAEDSELAEIQNLLVSGVYFPDKKR